MRREMTEPERRLWQALRNRQFHGIKFARQVRIGPYIADFAARTHGIVIEVDGDTHTDQARDARRTVVLEGQEFRVIRFCNADVMANLGGVLHALGMEIAR